METVTKQTKKTLPDLSGFIGTEQYHYLSIFKRLKYTDGWAHLANEVGCFWLADILESVQHLPKVKENQSFIVWRIVVKDQKAVVDAHWDCEGDGKFSDEKLVYKQEIEYTDFPEGTFEWYQCNDVVLLKSEY